mmetsp:Transcript_31128/g.88921  ORF Transcript_31128/g.88921 Transcript_31128/m.88921 type:complete len:155 (+) Transcript_31128:68-532(+)
MCEPTCCLAMVAFAACLMFLMVVAGAMGDFMEDMEHEVTKLLPLAMFVLMGATLYAMWKKQQQREQQHVMVAYGPVGTQAPPRQEMPVVQAWPYNPSTGGSVVQPHPPPTPGGQPKNSNAQVVQNNNAQVVQAVPVATEQNDVRAMTAQALRGA